MQTNYYYYYYTKKVQLKIMMNIIRLLEMNQILGLNNP